MKKLMTVLLALLIVIGLSPIVTSGETENTSAPFYSDVTEDLACYESICRLWQLGILPQEDLFRPWDTCTRQEFITMLYQLYLAWGGTPVSYDTVPFQDVPSGTLTCDAIMWAYGDGIVSGTTATSFEPDSSLTRQQCCAFLMRFAAAENIALKKTSEAALFQDAAAVSEYAKSYIIACQMSGLISGYSDGTFQPASLLSRNASAMILDRLWQAMNQTDTTGETVSAAPDAYLSYYNVAAFGEPVPESAPVPVDWFKDAVFIGDSVTVRLELYCQSTKALGSAQFLCSTSLSAPNALSAVTSKSMHPSYNGTKMKVEDAVALCGAKNVYIMLGINSMRDPISSTTKSLVTLIGKIREKAPDVNILIESVTPMTSTSTILNSSINNAKIEEYNARMLQLCSENKWYYLDVASQFRDDQGNLIPEYCSDKNSMGIHFTSTAAQLWVDYLRSHVPDDLK